MKLRRTLLLSTLLVVAIAATVPLRDGEPLLRWRDLQKLPERGVSPILQRAEGVTPRVGKGTVTGYRWRDADGIHLTNTPPPPGVAFETIEVNPNDNALPAFEPRK